ncbi:16S rRNA (guanine(966)-N(2))-methyltransferase [hydrothermal vent metagenome]|uniref:16S rRNA (Guanine(966)-N(2))-methyltransferase n=1 Tax=hydrothermal vent metagenome TaxID=652676 RepID=A0A3B0XR71_9ZZZZ
MVQKRVNKAGGKLRIIGGKWRSRQLPVAELEGLRPTTDRVRETLFNWLQSEVSGAHCLDLFAGSGALGFEAASRGAASVLMLEVQRQAANVLAHNIQRLDAQCIELVHQDAIQWLKAPPAQRYNIVFVDPPFSSDYLGQVCELLECGQYLAENALIYLEMGSAGALPELPASWAVAKEKKTGQVAYYLIKSRVK